VVVVSELGVVVVVSAVVDDGAGGTISAALSVGDGGVALVVVLSVMVMVDDDEVVTVVVVARGADVDVVWCIGTAGADGRWRELCAVWMTANTRISRSSTAAVPEA
jgi:hypothetical protein